MEDEHLGYRKAQIKRLNGRKKPREAALNWKDAGEYFQGSRRVVESLECCARRTGETGSSACVEIAEDFERFVSVVWLWEPDYSGLWYDWRAREWRNYVWAAIWRNSLAKSEGDAVILLSVG